MQPFTRQLAEARLGPCPSEIKVGPASYRVELNADPAVVRENGKNGEKTYPIVHVMGGKNVYYLLTPLERGRLQVLPLAYDVRRKEWYDTAASGMRHFGRESDQPLDWRDPLFTFNTSCYGCHVSQLALNYNLETDTYHTAWAEPGINCETCHGPSGKHVQAFTQAVPGKPPEQLGLISTKSFTPEQHNAACSVCHAKMSWITSSYPPGERYFDHYDLVTLENPDFYPDGRDLGENYTYTGWRMNRCAYAGQMHCLHCHASSGRYIFIDQPANNACLPCHADRVKNATAHTHHKEGSVGNECIACHMPQTEFARMRRTDHSMRPPTPATTLAFKSPNACNLCHKDQDAAWADQQVRRWHRKDYQAPVLHQAGLIAAARRHDWSRLPQMLSYLSDKGRDEIFTTSLIRLLGHCTDSRKWPALHQALKDPSPLVRSAAALGLIGHATPESQAALLAATGDEYRLVRIRAATVLGGLSRDSLSLADRRRLDSATQEDEAALKARPDDWNSQYNLGNHYLERGERRWALKAYQNAHWLRPDVVLPLVNAAMAHAQLGQTREAEQSLTKALVLEPTNAVANFNLGLLRAEQHKPVEAERCLRLALKSEPTMAQAAYNLAVLLASDRLLEAIEWCRKAHQAQPDEPKYAYTLAFYLNTQGDRREAMTLLRQLIARHPQYDDSYGLLASLYEQIGDRASAAELYRQRQRRGQPGKSQP
jgi:tetratricopeptide (TPR) repeat protein